MTRDEAISLIVKALTVEALVDAYAALGMLKLDEPKSAREKFEEAIRALGYRDLSLGANALMDAFDASLK